MSSRQASSLMSLNFLPCLSGFWCLKPTIFRSPPAVLIAMKWGALSPAARVKLENRGVLLQDVRITQNDLRGILGACWGSSFWLSAELRQALAEAIGHDPEDQTSPVDDAALDNHGPLCEMSTVGLSDFVDLSPLRSDWPLVISVGDTADDFALAIALDWCMPPALWVPPTILGSDTVMAVADALMYTWMSNDRDRTIHLTSCSLEYCRSPPSCQSGCPSARHGRLFPCRYRCRATGRSRCWTPSAQARLGRAVCRRYDRSGCPCPTPDRR